MEAHPASRTPVVYAISKNNSALNAGVVVFPAEAPSFGTLGRTPDVARLARMGILNTLLASSGFNDTEFDHPHKVRQAKWLRDAFVGTPLQNVLPTFALHHILLWAHEGELMNLNGFPMVPDKRIQGPKGTQEWRFTKGGVGTQVA